MARPKRSLAASEAGVATEPAKALVNLGDKNLGPSPVLIEIEEGKPVTLEVTKKGYKPRTVTVDGTDLKPTVRLDAITSARPPAGSIAPPAYRHQECNVRPRGLAARA